MRALVWAAILCAVCAEWAACAAWAGGASWAGGAARILAVLPTNTRSHDAMYARLVRALAQRGHHVTLFTHFPMKNPPPNIEEINLAGSIPEITNNLTTRYHSMKPSFVDNLDQIMKECVHACDVLSRNPAMKSLLNSTITFDLIIVEVFGSECFLPLGRRFEAPVVGLLSSVPLPWVNRQLGNPEETAYVPAYMMGYGQMMNLWERFANTIAVFWAKAQYEYKSQIPSQVIADRLFGPGPKLEALAQNYSLVLSNSHFSINEVRPLVPALVEVGGLHLDDSQKLSNELEAVLNESNDGVVYWSFGSMSRIETIPTKILEQMFLVISELPQVFLIKMNRAMLPRNLTVPDNVYTMEWIPQYATLCHRNVRVFVSHGGLLGTQEAVACGVPMLTVPLFADQALNARAMADRGVARLLALNEVDQATWREALRDLLSDHRYKENALKLRDRFLDRPLPPLDTGVYWIEYVLRHKGASHLRSPALNLTYSQHHLLDLAAVSMALVLLTMFLLHLLFRYLCTRCIKWWPQKKLVFEKSLFRRQSVLLWILWNYKVKPN